MKLVVAVGEAWRRHPDSNRRMEVLQTSALPLGYAAIKKWSGKRELNPRLRPWQGRTLPLSYSRSTVAEKVTASGCFVNKKSKRCPIIDKALPPCQKWILLLKIDVDNVGTSEWNYKMAKKKGSYRRRCGFEGSKLYE